MDDDGSGSGRYQSTHGVARIHIAMQRRYHTRSATARSHVQMKGIHIVGKQGRWRRRWCDSDTVDPVGRRAAHPPEGESSGSALVRGSVADKGDRL